MGKIRFVQLLGCVAIVVVLACGQRALAEDGKDHWQVRVLHGKQAGVRSQDRAFGLYFISEGFAALPPLDGSGDDEWPCEPGLTSNDADCSSIASGGLVIGEPAYYWLLSDCAPASATNCGQIYLFYEDDTGSTSDLITRIVARQGTYMILDTGKVNHGANAAPAGSTVILSYDTAFGTQGNPPAKGVGYCEGTKSLCQVPVAGPVTVTLTVEIGQSEVMKSFTINLYTPSTGEPK